jgi:hypothetical protein
MQVMPPTAGQAAEPRNERPRTPREQQQRDFREWTQAPKQDSAATDSITESSVHELAGQVAKREGVVDAQLYPWALQALYGWSQVRGPTQQATALSALISDAHALAGTAFASLRNPATLAGVPMMPALAAQSTSLANLVSWRISTSSGSNSSTQQARQTPAAVPALAEPWPERLLRRSLGGDGVVTWWLRDFRLGADEQTRVADNWFSHSAPETAARLVINGVEVRRPLSHAAKEADTWR